MKTRKPRQRSKSHSETTADSAVKGKIVELIVTAMHEVENVTVEQNARLPVPGSQRKREIDVLITGSLAGYPVRIAVECKNHRAAIDSPRIDEFVGKLRDVGIPTEQGIYVSVNGFTRGAVERSEKVGIRALILTGLTSDRIASHIEDAFQAVVYLLLVVRSITIVNTVPPPASGNRIAYGQMQVFCTANGQVCGSTADLIRKKWREGYPSSSIGEFELNVEVPSVWYQLIDGKIARILSSLTANVQVLGLAVTIPGRFSRHHLLNASNKKVEKFRTDVSFDATQSEYPVTTFCTEEELEKFIVNRKEAVRLTMGRIRLPRIRLGPIYWPPSDRVAAVLLQRMQDYQAGKITDLEASDLSGIEGNDFGALWEPIWQGNSSGNTR